jgi:hypothetical protein
MQGRIRQAHLFAVVVAAALVVALGGTALAQGNFGPGTWKLNLAKSKFDPGPAPKSETRVYELWEKDGIKATFTIVGADGKTFTREYAAHYDGKDYKYTSSPDFDTIALKLLDTNTLEATLKKGGKVVLTQKVVLSGNGKVRTLTTIMGTNHDVVVYDRQ